MRFQASCSCGVMAVLVREARPPHDPTDGRKLVAGREVWCLSSGPLAALWSCWRKLDGLLVGIGTTPRVLGCRVLAVDLYPLQPHHVFLFVGNEIVESFVLHVPAIHDAIHDDVERLLIFRLPQLEAAGMIIQGVSKILSFALLERRYMLAAKRKTVLCTGPMQLTAVVATTAVTEILEHAPGHQTPST